MVVGKNSRTTINIETTLPFGGLPTIIPSIPMKRIALLLLAVLPYVGMAQSGWEIPDMEKKTEKKAPERSKEKKEKTSIDPKYGIGAIPTVDGKVEWNITIPVKGKTAEEIFNKALETVSKATKDKGQSGKSRITAVNRTENIIAAHFDEEMVFSNSTFAKDFAEFRYTLIITCKDAEEQVSLCRISYKYNVGRAEEEIMSAEEIITDENAINKKKTRFYKMHGKFRKKTIDRVEEVFDMLRLGTVE